MSGPKYDPPSDLPVGSPGGLEHQMKTLEGVVQTELTLARQRLAENEGLIAEHRQRLYEQQRDGVDDAEASRALSALIDLQAIYVAEVDRLQRALSAVG